ncbi:uncharacterized protein LOC117643504 [Thrips palmi]|uniref:Uncharacterized protein LOC117643504 n=1 Tax=Thrips palmi TaxID=161013 RepID=A0A6P8ZL67_THRPL|nr:uncharacterized protein LOC117643504 [Thrips palmi]
MIRHHVVGHQIHARGSVFLLPFILLWTIGPLLALGNVRSKNINNFAGPYIAFGHKFDPCPSDGTIEVLIRASHFNPARPYDLQTISGNLSSKEDMKDNYWSRVEMAVRSNNQWKDNAFIFNFPRLGCTAIREQVPDLFRIIAKHSGAPTDKAAPCVIPAGVYVLKNESVSWTFPNFPVIPYGRYRFRVTSRSITSRTTLLCLEVDCEAIPKP